MMGLSGYWLMELVRASVARVAEVANTQREKDDMALWLQNPQLLEAVRKCMLEWNFALTNTKEMKALGIEIVTDHDVIAKAFSKDKTVKKKIACSLRCAMDVSLLFDMSKDVVSSSVAAENCIDFLECFQDQYITPLRTRISLALWTVDNLSNIYGTSFTHEADGKFIFTVDATNETAIETCMDIIASRFRIDTDFVKHTGDIGYVEDDVYGLPLQKRFLVLCHLDPDYKHN